MKYEALYIFSHINPSLMAIELEGDRKPVILAILSRN